MRRFMERWRDWRGARLARHPYVVATVALERDRAYRDGQENPPTEVVLARVDIAGERDAAFERGWREALQEVRARAFALEDAGDIPRPYRKAELDAEGDRIVARAQRTPRIDELWDHRPPQAFAPIVYAEGARSSEGVPYGEAQAAAGGYSRIMDVTNEPIPFSRFAPPAPTPDYDRSPYRLGTQESPRRAEPSADRAGPLGAALERAEQLLAAGVVVPVSAVEAVAMMRERGAEVRVEGGTMVPEGDGPLARARRKFAETAPGHAVVLSEDEALAVREVGVEVRLEDHDGVTYGIVAEGEALALGQPASPPRVEDVGEHAHDSTRRDGLLDDHCLVCGADGYWQNGALFPGVGERVPHPGGKTLLRVKG
jgi:hypothetical protein